MEMILQVKVMSQGNGPVLTLCDDSGTPLPNQQTVELFNSFDDIPKVTVSFIIDNKKVRLVGPEQNGNTK
jgi:hypothetical protein